MRSSSQVIPLNGSDELAGHHPEREHGDGSYASFLGLMIGMEAKGWFL